MKLAGEISDAQRLEKKLRRSVRAEVRIDEHNRGVHEFFLSANSTVY